MRIHSIYQRSYLLLAIFCLFNLAFVSFFTAKNGIKAQAATPPITEFPLPNPNSYLYSITSGLDGNIWFTESDGNKIGRITPSGVITEFTVPSSASSPEGIAADLDGNIWFTEAAGRIGKITPSGVITEFNLSGSDWPESIALGADKNLWFTDQAPYLAEIGRITPNGIITYFLTPTLLSYPRKIIAGPDGNLWFTEYVGNKIGRITPGGTITEFSVPTIGSEPFDITSGPDGNLWFTEYVGNKIGRITPGGTITEFSVPMIRSGFDSITSGPDGNLWFTEYVGNKIGRVNITRSTPTSPTPSAISKTITQIVGFIQDSVSTLDAVCKIIICTSFITVPVEFLSRLFTIADLSQAIMQTVILDQKLASLNQAIKQYGLHSPVTCLAAQATYGANRNLHRTLISLVPLTSIFYPLPVGDSPGCR